MSLIAYKLSISFKMYFFNTSTAFSPSLSNLTASNGFNSYVFTTASAEMFLITSTSLSSKITDAQSSPQPVIVTTFASSKIGEQLLGCAEYSVMHAATILSFSSASSTVAALQPNPTGLIHYMKPMLFFHSFFHHPSVSLFNFIVTSFVKWTLQYAFTAALPVGSACLS